MSTTHAAGAPAHSGSTERSGEIEQGDGRADEQFAAQTDREDAGRDHADRGDSDHADRGDRDHADSDDARGDARRRELNTPPERGTRETVPAAAPAGPRRVKLTVSRVDPWSAMKISFLLSVAAGIAGVVLMAVLWLVLSGMGVFADVNRAISEVLGHSASTFNLMDYIGFDRVVSLSVVIGVVDIVLLTALATLGAVLYNICSGLVGGLQVTLTDD